MSRLNVKILDHLSKKLDLKENSIRQYISGIKVKYPELTQNAAAHFFALSRRETVRRMLTKEDKKTLRGTEIIKPERIKVKQIKENKNKVIEFFKYNTDNEFLRGHINEIDKAYTATCYTCVFILCRKVIENLIIAILEKKFPRERVLYWDNARERYLDFSIILNNLYNKRLEFNPSKIGAIERLKQLAKPFKKDCNNKTHSLFHLVKRKKEIDDIGINEILGLIKILEK
jgi:hypothetical protein